MPFDQRVFETAAVVFISMPSADFPLSQTALEIMLLHKPMEITKAIRMYFMRVVIARDQLVWLRVNRRHVNFR